MSMSDRKLPIERSERILGELLKIPVNTICCDCGAANPKWASYSLGCFICVRCCSVHRKMGTHISKVKSVSLDQWTQEDIEVMKNWGNGKVNAMYMPNPERHPPPTSMEGSAMEQYIRSKYERKEFMEGGGNYQPSTRSAYGNTFSGGRGGPSNDIVNTHAYTTQMSALRGMGFTDNAKNLQVLQSTNGDVPAATEILCRIGSGPVTSSANLSASNSPSRNTTRRTASSNSVNRSGSGGGGSDSKETILWNMGFHDSALNKEALRRAGGNVEVAAGVLIDDKEKLAKAVREKSSSSSPLPARLDPPGAKQKSDNNLLLDLSDDSSSQLQQQQQQLLQQQQMLQQMQMQNAFGNTNQQMFNQNNDMFGQNHNQLQSILDKNANILALYGNDNNNNNNNNVMNMNSAFGLQQQQQPVGNMNDMNSWVTNNNNNNNMAMNSAFGVATSMPTGSTGNNLFGNVNNNNNNMAMGMNMGMGMNSAQQLNNPFGQGLGGNNLNNNNMLSSMGNNAFGTVNSNPTGLAGNNLFATNNVNNNNNQFSSMSQTSSPMTPFSTVSSNNNMNNNAFVSGTSQAMNPMGNMGMNNMNTNNFNSTFGIPNNNNNNFNTFNNNNSNPWGNQNNNNLF